MNLKERIKSDFMTAYKAKEFDKKNFLGFVLGGISTKEGQGIESTDENVLKVLKSIVKGLIENIESRELLGNDASNEKLELTYLNPYLPILMNEDELRVIIIEMVNNNPDKNQGFLLGLFNRENTGKAFDNKLVSKIIGETLK